MKNILILSIYTLIAGETIGQVGDITYKDKWVTFNSVSSQIAKTNITDLGFDADNALWVTSSQGVAKYHGDEEWTTFNSLNSGLSYDNIVSVEIDNENNKWFSTWGGGIYMFNGQNWVNFNAENSGLLDNKIYAFIITSDQNKWIAPNMVGLQEFNDWKKHTEYSISPNDYVYCTALYEDQNSHIWAGTREGELSRFDGNRWAVYVPPATIGPNWINVIGTWDFAGVWMGTSGQGLVRFYENKWAYFTPDNSDQPSLNILEMKFSTDNKMWLGTTDGLVIFDGTEWTILNTSNSKLPSNTINAIVFDDYNNAWIGTSKGLVVYNEEGIKEVIGIKQPKSTTKDVSVYPIPAVDVLKVNNKPDHLSKIEIANINGQIVRTISGNGSNSIDVSNLNDGIYLITFFTKDNTVTRKFIKGN